MSNKTLIGKNNWLFLQNDSAKELEVHNNNLCLVNDSFYHKYANTKHKYFLTVFPNKSYLYKQYLPDGYDLKYRPGFDKYKQHFNEYVLDGHDILKHELDTYYKTDTHINLKGNHIIYNHFIYNINRLFNLNFPTKIINLQSSICDSLTNLQKGIGDLTWATNLGEQSLSDISDTYYYSDDVPSICCAYTVTIDSHIRFLNVDNNQIVDKTNDNINAIVDWNIISKYILYKKNSEHNINLKILIFYDSFLISMLSVYLDICSEVYMSKNICSPELINVIQPDYIFEFRAERFLF